MGLLAFIRRRLVLKIGIASLFAVTLGFVAYSMFSSHQAGRILVAETRDSSQRLAHGLVAGMQSAMIGGNGILVSDLIQSAQRELPTVTIHVFDAHGAPVFEPRGPAPSPDTLPAPLRQVLADAQRHEVSGMVHRPVLNEKRCHECHDPKAKLRGVLALEVDPGRAQAGRDEILGVALTGAFEQVMTARKTELLDAYFTELRIAVPSITGVAVFDQDSSLTFGEAPTGDASWKSELQDAMRPGAGPRTVTSADQRIRIVPMPYEKRCAPCHDDTGPVRGALVVGFGPLPPGGASAELEGVIDTSLRVIMMSSLGRLVTRYLSTLESTRATRQLRLYDAEGRMYFDAIEKPRPPPDVASVLAQGKGTVREESDDTLVVVEPLLNEERCQRCHGDDLPLRGAIEIRASTGRATRARRSAITNAVQFAIVTVVIVFALLWLALKRIVLDPVRRIGAVAERVGHGDLAVAEVRGASARGDEVARLGNRINQMVRGLRAKLHLEKFVSRGASEAAEGAASGTVSLSREGIRKACTVLFTDIRGFTAFSERVEPEIVVLMLNRILAAQAAVVERYGGDIDKFVGDELMAVFHGDDGPAKAVRCALDMVDAVDRAREGEETIAVGGGISYGDVVYGAIGAERRMDFTVIGDVVNIGARLCSRAAAGEVLVSAAVRDHAGELLGIDVERVEPLELKGKAVPLEAYRVRTRR